MGRLEGKSVIITGAGSGIGRAASLLFTKEGARLIAVDRSEAARPMPLPAPVMMTDLPSRRPMSFSLVAFVSLLSALAAQRNSNKISNVQVT